MHDCKGRELKVGDRVIVECVIAQAYAGQDYCNITLATVHPMPPYTEPTQITLNARQVEKIDVE